LAQARALLEIMPADTHSNDMLGDRFDLLASDELGLRGPDAGYRAIDDDNNVVAVLLPVLARDGYSGDIRVLVGIKADASIAGVRVLSHNETPGLGDKVELKKSDWVLDFNGKSLTNPSLSSWKVRKDGGEFDAFTGATITPRAVTKAVLTALQYFDNHRQQLLQSSMESQ
jgi:electron transport complex protein RnfG